MYVLFLREICAAGIDCAFLAYQQGSYFGATNPQTPPAMPRASSIWARVFWAGEDVPPLAPRGRGTPRPQREPARLTTSSLMQPPPGARGPDSLPRSAEPAIDELLRDSGPMDRRFTRSRALGVESHHHGPCVRAEAHAPPARILRASRRSTSPNPTAASSRSFQIPDKGRQQLQLGRRCQFP